MRAAAFGLDALGQGGNVLPGTRLVIDSHAGRQNGVFVDGRQEFFGVDMAVTLGGDLHDGEAFLF